MNLTNLGFDSFFLQNIDTRLYPDCTPARVSRVDRDRYLVLNEHGEVSAEPTGKLLFAAESPVDLPCVGDWVLVQYHNEGALAIVHAVLPRRTRLRRKAAGDNIEYQMIAANIDVALLVQSCDTNFNLRRLERYLVMTAEGGMEPVILLSKSELLSPEQQAAHVAAIREARVEARVVMVSSVAEEGIATLQPLLEAGKTYCLLGSSGVGKTTLLNRLLGDEVYATGPIREKDGRGRHTTSQRQLTVLADGALVIDTPGMRELGLLGVEEGIETTFSDIAELMEHCRFDNCTHTVEAGCALLEAVERDALSRERYESYMKLLRESAYYEMSYVERRKRDREFGRFQKNAMDELSKRKPSAY